MPDGRSREFTWVQECNSVITFPCPEKPLADHGQYEVGGLAWSGRGKIKAVDVSFDGGVNWQPARLKGLVIASGGLALATTPEVFLVLWAQNRGLDIALIPLVWAGASAVKMLVAVPAGSLSDRLGRLPVVITGWASRIALLIALAFSGSATWLVWLLFLGYAGSLALTEAAERSLVGESAPVAHRATVFGIYHIVTGLLALPGALLFGVVWQFFGEQAAFLMAAALTALAALALGALARQTQP